MFKKWRVAVGRLQRSPEICLPPESVIDLDIRDQHLAVLFSHRDRQPFNPIGGEDVTSVAVTLFIKVFILFQYDFLAGSDRTEILQAREEMEIDEDGGHGLLVTGHWFLVKYPRV